MVELSVTTTRTEGTAVEDDNDAGLGSTVDDVDDAGRAPVSGNVRWEAACEWAEDLAVLAFRGGDRRSWDHRAAAGIVATAAYALAHRYDVPEVRDLGLDRLICPLFDQESLMALATSELSAAGHSLDHPDPDDPVSMTWAWLNREWPVDEDGFVREDVPGYPPRWSIGGRCAPQPAIEVYRTWAGIGVDTALSAERGALPTRTAVRVTGGPFAGESGRLEHATWDLNADLDRVEPGPPGGYMVNFGPVPNADRVDVRVERVLAEHLVPEEDTILDMGT